MMACSEFVEDPEPAEKVEGLHRVPD